MLVICTKNKVTASHTFKKGEKYDIRSGDAIKGIEADEAFLKQVSKAESDKFYGDRQKKAHNAKQIAAIQAAEGEGGSGGGAGGGA